MEENKLVKYENRQLQKVGKAISVTNKLLSSTEPQLIPYRKKDKWGFCTPDKKILIDCVYQDASQFSEGLASVSNFDNSQFGNSGYIDNQNDIIIPFKYFYSESFSNGYAQVYLDPFIQVKALINKFGDVILRGFYELNKICNGMAKFSVDMYIENPEGGGVTSQLYGFINPQEKFIIEPIYEDADDFSENLAAVKLNNLWGFVDNKGETVISFKYQSAQSFSEGKALVQLNRNHKLDSQWVFIDINENISFLDTNEYFYDTWWHKKYYEGLLRVFKSYRYGFIDKRGNLAIPCMYEASMNFSEGLAGVQEKNLWGFIDKQGNEVVPFIYQVVNNFSEGLAAVKMDGKWGFINRNGELVIPCKYLEDLSSDYERCNFSQGLCKVGSHRGEFGYIDKQGVEYWED